MRACPAICDGRCGYEACARCFVDNKLDEKLGTMYDRGMKQLSSSGICRSVHRAGSFANHQE
jgi:hypothetical protein